MKQLTVKLKQHTPLIHFQHYQEGATLRASEVKPRLDRYILEIIGKDNDPNKDNNSPNKDYYNIGYRIAEKKGWLIGANPLKKEQFALNYKMRIDSEKYRDLTLNVSQNKKFKYETENFPMLLSNMGGKNDKQDLVNFSMYDNISIKFQFFSNTNNLQEIYDIIKDNVELFFLTRNFGQRVSKGFGSFTVESIEEDSGNTIPIILSNSISKLKKCMIRYEYQENDNISTLFNVIDFYWKCLKSGVNSTKRIIVNNKIKRKYSDKPDKRYIKSYLWTFLNDRGHTWEKRTIKQSLNLSSSPATNDKNEYRDNNNNIFYARAFLGCPINGFTYRIATGKIENYYNKNKQRYEDKEKFINKEIEIKCNNGEIKRIPSPILFKPIIHDINGKRYVSILILIDKEIVKSLYGLKDKNIIFTFNKLKDDDSKFNNKKKIEPNVNINLFAKDKYMIDFLELIKEYHNHMKNELDARDYKWNKILTDRKIELITI